MAYRYLLLSDYMINVRVEEERAHREGLIGLCGDPATLAQYRDYLTILFKDQEVIGNLIGLMTNKAANLPWEALQACLVQLQREIDGMEKLKEQEPELEDIQKEALLLLTTLKKIIK